MPSTSRIPLSTATEQADSGNTSGYGDTYAALHKQFQNSTSYAGKRTPAVIAVSASALFDTGESEVIFAKYGLEAYIAHQAANVDKPLEPGPVMPLIQRLLALNASTGQRVVDIIILSKNDENTGARINKAIDAMGLDIQQVEFLNGINPTDRAQDLDVDLLLSGNEHDITDAIEAGLPGGNVYPSTSFHEDDKQLLVAFDFDGVLASDESEKVFAESGVEGFNRHEQENYDIPHRPGPMLPFLRALNRIQEVEKEIAELDPNYKPQVRIAIVTARGAQAARRAILSVNSWGCSTNELFLLSGRSKKDILATMKPHIFFDDQKRHLEGVSDHTASTHVPFGIRN